jgi:hypothetical protein
LLYWICIMVIYCFGISTRARKLWVLHSDKLLYAT